MEATSSKRGLLQLENEKKMRDLRHGSRRRPLAEGTSASALHET